MKKVLAVAVAVVVVIGAAGALLWVRGGDEPPPLQVDDVAADPSTPDDADAATGTALDGEWVVVTGEDTVAGLRIDEERAAGLGNHTAVGRTGAVDGSLTVVDDTITAGSFTVDLRQIEFTDDPGLPVADRSEYLRTRALRTDTFPTAGFTVNAPVELPDLTEGTATIEIPGVLDLHGVEVERTLAVDVRVDGDEAVLGTTSPAPVRLSDHQIEAPEIPGIAKVVDEGQFEFVVVLRRT